MLVILPIAFKRELAVTENCNLSQSSNYDFEDGHQNNSRVLRWLF